MQYGISGGYGYCLLFRIHSGLPAGTFCAYRGVSRKAARPRRKDAVIFYVHGGGICIATAYLPRLLTGISPPSLQTVHSICPYGISVNEEAYSRFFDLILLPEPENRTLKLCFFGNFRRGICFFCGDGGTPCVQIYPESAR